ncbi:MAG: WG repeat-containing protein, partial [Muribaculaceae bacterium]
MSKTAFGLIWTNRIALNLLFFATIILIIKILIIMKKSCLLFLVLAFSAVCALASAPVPFEKKGKFGLQDAETGEVIVKPKYTEIVEVADGFAIVADKDYKGIVNFQGKEVVKCDMVSIDRLSDNYWLMVDKKDRIKIFSKSKSKQIQLVNAYKAESNGYTLLTATASAIKLGMPMYNLGEVLLLQNGNRQIVAGEKSIDMAFDAPEERRMPSSTEYREKGFETIPTFIPFKSYEGSEFFIYGMGSDRYKWQVRLIDKGNFRVLHSSFDGDNCEITEINAFYSMKKQQLYVKVPNSCMTYGRLCIGLDSLYHCEYNDNLISEGYDQIRETLFGLFASRDGYWAKILVGEAKDKIEIKYPIPTKECPFVSSVGSTNIFIVKNDEGKMGVISPEGDFVLECVSDSIKNVGSQLMVSSNGKSRIYDYKTKEYL